MRGEKELKSLKYTYVHMNTHTGACTVGCKNTHTGTVGHIVIVMQSYMQVGVIQILFDACVNLMPVALHNCKLHGQHLDSFTLVHHAWNFPISPSLSAGWGLAFLDWSGSWNADPQSRKHTLPIYSTQCDNKYLCQIMSSHCTILAHHTYHPPCHTRTHTMFCGVMHSYTRTLNTTLLHAPLSTGNGDLGWVASHGVIQSSIPVCLLDLPVSCNATATRRKSWGKERGWRTRTVHTYVNNSYGRGCNSY